MTENTIEFSGGVELCKHVERDEYEMPSIVYEFTSERTEPVTVQVVESLFESLNPEHLGFHQDFEPENWSIKDEELLLEVELNPEAEYKTIYAVRPNASVKPEQLIESPAKFSVTPEPEALMRGGKAESVSQSVATGSPERPDRTEQTDTPPERTPEASKQSDPKEAPEGTIATNGGGEAGPQLSASSDEAVPDDGVSLVDQLVVELQAGRASEESLDYLEQEFGTTNHNSGSMDARIKQLQHDFADLRAYTGALEEFLNENGSAREVVNSLQNRLETVDDEIDSLESTVDEQGSDVAEIREEVHDVQSEVESVSAEMSALAEDVEELSSQVDRVDDQLPAYDIEERISELEDDIAETTAFTNKLRGALQQSFSE
jgi:predicted  nucleic acid-binding Zn-ribbon protein